MSLAGLVQYDSSDNSDEENSNEDIPEVKKKIDETYEVGFGGGDKSLSNTVKTGKHERELLLPEPMGKDVRLGSNDASMSSADNSFRNLCLNSLPKPKNAEIDEAIEEDEDDNYVVPKTTKFIVEKPPKKGKGPVKISIPSLSDFDDIDEKVVKKNVIQPSKKSCGVLALLPPPGSEAESATNLIPHSVSQKPSKSAPLIPMQAKKNIQVQPVQKISLPKSTNASSALSALNYDSNTDDEEEEISKNAKGKTLDFFSLSESVDLPLTDEIVAANILPVVGKRISTDFQEESTETDEDKKERPNATLTSTVMDLPKDEILLKNKAEVGPKLPVPEQEFNVDAEGNVAFDDKAIEYLCGKRGVKRKNEIMNENEIIDINGDDMKPDEREWLVKALTEEPVRRPISLGSGPSSQSKKKHQITYLAHQAKAMEIELQNQWASSNLARKQTRSKYGF